MTSFMIILNPFSRLLIDKICRAYTEKNRNNWEQ